MSETFDFSELEGQYTERSLVTEATARATVRKGDYTLDIKQISPRVATEQSPFPGRKGVTLQLACPTPDGKTVTMWQDVSWEVYREINEGGERTLVRPGDDDYDASLKMDKQSRLWAQIEKVYNPDGEMSIPELVKALPGSQIGAFIMEGFVNEAGDMRWPEARQNDFGSYDEWVAKYDAEKAEAANAGYLPKNFISNFHKVKA